MPRFLMTLRERWRYRHSVRALRAALNKCIRGHRTEDALLAMAHVIIERFGGTTPPPVTPAADPRNGDGWELAVASSHPPLMTYSDYLQTQHWSMTRDPWKVGRCEDCGRDGRTELHHLTYARLFCERREDVEELCRDCHERRHALPKAA